MIHEAGPLVERIQLCVYCNKTLADYTRTYNPEVNKGWPGGAWINIDEKHPELSGLTKESPNCYVYHPE